MHVVINVQHFFDTSIARLTTWICCSTLVSDPVPLATNSSRTTSRRKSKVTMKLCVWLPKLTSASSSPGYVPLPFIIHEKQLKYVDAHHGVLIVCSNVLKFYCLNWELVWRSSLACVYVIKADKSYLKSTDDEWFFFSPLGKKCPHGTQTRRATVAGFWKVTGKERLVKFAPDVIDARKTLVFYRGRTPTHYYPRLVGKLCKKKKAIFFRCI